MTKNLNKKLPSLNGLRALSVMIVIIHHLAYRYDIFYSLMKFKYLTPILFFMQDGQFGVNVFFVISGFLITLLLINEELQFGKISLKYFYTRRIFRIFPAYYFLLLSYFILQYLNIIYVEKNNWIKALFYLTGFSANKDWLTGHFWSLSVEEFFYLLWPICFLKFKTKRTLITIFFILFVPVFRIFLSYHSISWINNLTIYLRIDSIALGCFIALKKDKIINMLSKHFFAFFLLSVIILFLLRYLSNLTYPFSGIATVFGTTSGTFGNVAIGVIMLYSVFSKSQSIWIQILNSKVLNYIGILSYSLYLWQQFFLNNSSSIVNNIPFNLLALFVFANFSYYCIELPFINLKNKFNFFQVKFHSYNNNHDQISRPSQDQPPI